MISHDEYLEYCAVAWDGYAAITEQLGDDLINARPDGLPGANSCFGLVAHLVGVAGR